MKHRNSFSLIEIVTAIAIITLCIIALLSTYYSIYRLQNMVMYNNILQKKAERFAK
ncbi:MAG: prepilin-type N-terminal cleavage/methylation domain-containing protein [Candidatus Methanomethylicia archaeon]